MGLDRFCAGNVGPVYLCDGCHCRAAPARSQLGVTTWSSPSVTAQDEAGCWVSLPREGPLSHSCYCSSMWD